jgi:hypothetical protein
VEALELDVNTTRERCLWLWRSGDRCADGDGDEFGGGRCRPRCGCLDESAAERTR